MSAADRHAGRESDGAPVPVSLETLLAHDDATLGALAIGMASCHASLVRFEALGRLVRAAPRDEQEAILLEMLRCPGRAREQMNLALGERGRNENER